MPKMMGVVVMLLALCGTVHAQGISNCGEPPPNINETMKGEILGKAQALSRFIANAELTGKIETSRTEIYSKYPDAEASRGNAFFEYQVCLLIMGDKTLSNMQKLDKLVEIRREFRQPIKKDHG